MQLEKPLSPYKIKNIDPRRITPAKYSPSSTTSDHNRILDMHRILHGDKNISSQTSLSPTKQLVFNQKKTTQKTQIPSVPLPNSHQYQKVQKHKRTVQTPNPLIQNSQNSKTILNPERRYQQQPMVYCPVCQRNYPTTRTKEHVQKHLQPDPVLIRTTPLNSIVTDIVTIPQPIPQAQTMMIVEPAEYFIDDVFGGNNFYIINNAQAIPSTPPFLQPQILVTEEIIQDPYASQNIPETSLHISGRKTNNIINDNSSFQHYPQPLIPQFNSSLSHQSQGGINLSQQHHSVPLQTIQQEMRINSHPSYMSTSKRSQQNMITSIPIVPAQTGYPFHQSMMAQSLGNGGVVPQENFMSMGLDNGSVPAYPIHYPMKKATTFNFFSCLDNIGNESFNAGSIIRRNDFYARVRQ